MPATQTPTQSPSTSGRGAIVLPASIATVYITIAFFQAHLKLLWGDEFVTYWIGKQRSFHGIWHALASGADPNPPLMHILNWASTAAFGSNSVAIRLPSILAMALALTSLWILLRRYTAPVYAAAGCLALMTSRGFDYTYDARSYGLLLGFALAALTAWDFARTATTIPKRVLYLFLTALALAAGLSSNYYGVLAFFPITAGELLHLYRTRKLHLGPWLAMAIAALPLLAYRPLIHANIAEFGPHAWNKPQLSMICDSYLVIVEGIIYPIAILFGIWLWKRRSNTPLAANPFPRELSLAAAVLFIYPFLGFALAYPGSAMISPRCVIPVIAGVVLIGVVLLTQIVPNRRIVTGIVTFLFVWVIARESACAFVLREQRHAFWNLRNDIERAAAPNERVIIGDSLVIMPLYWYASPQLRQQLVFPIDFAAIHRVEPDDSGEQNLWGGRNTVFPTPIALPAALIPTDSESILVASPSGWLAKTLTDQHFTLHLDETSYFGDLGGVFTPLAHPATRIFFITPPLPPTTAAPVSSTP